VGLADANLRSGLRAPHGEHNDRYLRRESQSECADNGCDIRHGRSLIRFDGRSGVREPAAFFRSRLVLLLCGSVVRALETKSTLAGLGNHGKRQRNNSGRLWKMRCRDRSKSKGRFHAKRWNSGLRFLFRQRNSAAHANDMVYLMLCPKRSLVLGEWDSLEARDRQLSEFAKTLRSHGPYPVYQRRGNQKRRSIFFTNSSSDSPLRVPRVPRHACHRAHDPEHHGERYTLVADESHIFTS
jgi:hypothetical protein